MDYSEFRAQQLKLGSKPFKVTNSYGTKAAWRWYKKNKWLGGTEVTEKEFGRIIKEVNLALLNQLLKGSDIKFPCGMGRIELRKYRTIIKFIDGKLVTNLPVDWKRTLHLWYSDTEAKNNKTLIREEPKEIFKVCYSKRGATYTNKMFYKFTMARSAKKKLKEKIIYNEIDAFLI